MNAAVQTLLDSFDDLPEADQVEVARQILRRAAQFQTDDLSDEALIAAADDLFRALDVREAIDADPPARHPDT